MSARRTQPDISGTTLDTRTHSAVSGPMARTFIPSENEPTMRASASHCTSTGATSAATTSRACGLCYHTWRWLRWCRCSVRTALTIQEGDDVTTPSTWCLDDATRVAG
jgi:hypothetical protein